MYATIFMWTGLLCSVLIAAPALARELRWTHFGLRPLGMGNAYVAVADDFNSLFYNPAGLARLKSFDGEFFNPYAEISANTKTFLDDLSNLSSGSGGDTDAVLSLLEKNQGKTHHFALGLTPHFVMQGFGFGIGGEINTTLAIHRDISVDLDFGPRLIAPVAFAMNFLENRLSLGASLKMLARGGINREFSVNDIQAFTKKSDKSVDGNDQASTKPKLSDYLEGGMGVGADIGLLFTPIKAMRPTLGISITDVGGTPYRKVNIGGEALKAPSTRLPSVNTGISIVPFETGNMYVMTAIDAHAINQPVHYSKKLNMGLEWGYGSIIKLQTGLHQGEPTAGFEFDVFLFSCRFTTYAEQLGTFAGQDKDLSDRRYAFQLKLLI